MLICWCWKINIEILICWFVEIQINKKILILKTINKFNKSTFVEIEIISQKFQKNRHISIKIDKFRQKSTNDNRFLMELIKISANAVRTSYKFFGDSKFSTNSDFCWSTFSIFCWFVEFCWFSTNVDLLIYFCWICWFVEICWKINKNKKSTSDFENRSTKTKIKKWFSRIFGALVRSKAPIRSEYSYILKDQKS